MIDRIGNSSEGFTAEALKIMQRADRLKSRLHHQEVSPRHVGTILVGYFKEAFGDRTTRQQVKRSLISWESSYGSSSDETVAFYETASMRAKGDEAIKKPITPMHLLYAMLTPDLQNPPIDPMPFVSGDELYSLIYREKVYAAAGGSIRSPHFNSPSYQVAQLDLERAETFRRTQRLEFTFIPEKLLDKATLPKAS